MEKIKILIAEDEVDYHTLYDKALTDDQFKKRFVENGEEAMFQYHSWKPEIILLDIQMPIKSGYATLKQIRSLEYGKKTNTVIIMVTVLTDKSDILDCAKVGIQGYILKPFKVSKVKDKILQYYGEALSK